MKSDKPFRYNNCGEYVWLLRVTSEQADTLCKDVQLWYQYKGDRVVRTWFSDLDPRDYRSGVFPAPSVHTDCRHAIQVDPPDDN